MAKKKSKHIRRQSVIDVVAGMLAKDLHDIWRYYTDPDAPGRSMNISWLNGHAAALSHLLGILTISSKDEAKDQ